MTSKRKSHRYYDWILHPFGVQNDKQGDSRLRGNDTPTPTCNAVSARRCTLRHSVIW